MNSLRCRLLPSFLSLCLCLFHQSPLSWLRFPRTPLTPILQAQPHTSSSSRVFLNVLCHHLSSSSCFSVHFSSTDTAVHHGAASLDTTSHPAAPTPSNTIIHQDFEKQTSLSLSSPLPADATYCAIHHTWRMVDTSPSSLPAQVLVFLFTSASLQLIGENKACQSSDRVCSCTTKVN